MDPQCWCMDPQVWPRLGVCGLPGCVDLQYHQYHFWCAPRCGLWTLTLVPVFFSGPPVCFCRSRRQQLAGQRRAGGAAWATEGPGAGFRLLVGTGQGALKWKYYRSPDGSNVDPLQRRWCLDVTCRESAERSTLTSSWPQEKLDRRQLSLTQDPGLYDYLVGPLDLDLLGTADCPLSPQKTNLFAEGSTATKRNQSWQAGVRKAFVCCLPVW